MLIYLAGCMSYHYENSESQKPNIGDISQQKG